MKAVKRNKSSGQNQSRLPYLITPMSAGCAALILAAAGSVHAQEATQASTPASDEQTVEEVVVTGIRASIEGAISVKKESDSIVEAISSEDIGKLPDTSVAESLARLPGIAAQRTGGRDQQISIRGLAPDFTTGLLNGREQVSTGDSRSVQYDQYPSELVSAVTVYKTPDGALVGQGLGGTVNIQTARPLNFHDRIIAGNYRREKLGVGSIAEGTGDRYSVAYIDQFFDHKLGIAAGFARLDETGPTTSRFESWGGGTYNLDSEGDPEACTTPVTSNCVNVPYNGFNAWADQTTQRRDGAMASIQFQPNEFFESSLDLFYAKFESTTATKGFQAPLNDGYNGSRGNYDSAPVLSDYTLSGSNVTSGTFSNVRAVVRNDADHTVDKLNSYGWNNKLRFTDSWAANLDLAYSKALKDQQHIETTAGTAQDALETADLDSVAFTSDGTFTPGFDYTDRNIIRLTDVQGWGGGVATPQAGYSKLPHVQDELKSVRLSFTKEFTDNRWFRSVDTGFNYSDRTKTRQFTEGRLVIGDGSDPLGSAQMPDGGTITLHGIPVAIFDPVAALGSLYSIQSKENPDIFNKDWTVYEKLYTFYSKADIRSTLFGLPVRGNVGAQLIKTEQSSRAFDVDRSTCVNDVCQEGTRTQGTSYYDFLPSLNLAFELSHDQVVRFALARQMARPTINDMRASFAFSLDTTNNVLTGSGGNPELKPFRANAVDLSYEKYFGKKAYFAAQAFYKDLTTYVITAPDFAYDFTPYITPTTPLPTDDNPVGIFSRPVNGSGGTIQGIELAASLPMEMMWEPLEGFGVQGSLAITSSAVKLPISGLTVDSIVSPTIPLPGLSKHVSQITAYFEKWGFEVRLSETQRSSFIGEVTSFTGDRQLSYIKGEKVLDGQLSYTFSQSWLKGLSLQFQGQNLTNAPFIRYRNDPNDQIENTKYGRIYLFGVNYKFQ